MKQPDKILNAEQYKEWYAKERGFKDWNDAVSDYTEMGCIGVFIHEVMQAYAEYYHKMKLEIINPNQITKPKDN